MMNETNLTAIYPPPPWFYSGEGLIVFTLRKKAGSLPEGCKFASRIPFRTLSGYYIGQYHTPLIDDENLPWHEWGNILGSIKKSKTRGFYMNVMGADSPSALCGGKDLWGLNKVQSTIHFQPKGEQGVASLEEEEGSIHLRWQEKGPIVRRKQDVTFLTMLRGEMLKFIVSMNGEFRFCRVEIDQQENPSFDALQARNYYGIRFINTNLNIMPPMQIT